MNNLYAWVAVLAVILIGGYWYMQQGASGVGGEGFGTYPYTCEGGAEFTMSPASDISSVTLVPGANAAFSTTTLAKVESEAGARFEGGDMVFTGAGESVQLTVGGATLNCSPVPNDEEPPFNWGDAGEGGGVKQDVGLIVSESIVGKWQSSDDAKFTREFKNDGTAVDMYDNEDASSGTWKVFTKENPVEVAFPIEADAVYVQMTMAGTEGDTLNFKVGKLTPDELQLVYMDRGGVLTFKSVK